MRNSLSHHPALKSITRDLIAGVPIKTVASRYNVSNGAVGRFRKNLVVPVIQGRNSSVKEVDSVHDVDTVHEVYTEAKASIAAASTADLVEERLGRYQTMLGKAEDDPKAWAAVARVDLSALELRAKLRGEVQQERAASVQVAIIMPGAEGAGPVIDVQATTEKP